MLGVYRATLKYIRRTCGVLLLSTFLTPLMQAAVAGTATAVLATGAVVAARNDAAADAMAAPFEALWDQVSSSAPMVSTKT